MRSRTPSGPTSEPPCYGEALQRLDHGAPGGLGQLHRAAAGQAAGPATGLVVLPVLDVGAEDETVGLDHLHRRSLRQRAPEVVVTPEDGLAGIVAGLPGGVGRRQRLPAAGAEDALGGELAPLGLEELLGDGLEGGPEVLAPLGDAGEGAVDDGTLSLTENIQTESQR